MSTGHNSANNRRHRSTAGRRRLRHGGTPLLLRGIRLSLSLLNRLSPRLAGRWLSRLWFKGRRFKEPLREQRWREQAEQSFLTCGNLELAVYVWPQQGPAVLLLHGWNGRGAQMGAFVEPLQQAGYRVVAFDAPAHGRSSGRSTHLFEIVQALFEVERVHGPFHAVIAHSFGGMVLARALRDGLDTGRVVAISTPARLGFLIDHFCQYLHAPLAARQHFVNDLKILFGDDIEASVSTENNARALTLPALIIHDEDDRDVCLEQGQLVAEAWPGADLVTTRGLGHRRILRDPEILGRVVKFIKAG